MKIGFFSLLTVVFVTLKLTEVIAWSWWLVLLPLYGTFILGLLLTFGAAFLMAWAQNRE